MATAESQVKIKVSADGTEAEATFSKISDTAGTMKTNVIGSMRRMATGVAGTVEAFDRVKSAMEKAMAPVIVIRAAIDAFVWLRDAIKGADEATRELGKAAIETSKAIKDSGLNSELYNAVKVAADAAGVSADELNAKLAEFAQHKITFDELAAAVGRTGEALQRTAANTNVGHIGTQYLAGHEQDLIDAEEGREQVKINRRGLKLIISRIIELNNEGRAEETDELWDMLAKESLGDRDYLSYIWQSNKRWHQRDLHFYGEWGPQQANAAIERYDETREAARAENARIIKEHDAQIIAEREAKAAEEAAKAQKEAAEREARATEEAEAARKAAAEAERKAAEAAEREEARRQAAIDSQGEKIAAETVKANEAIDKIRVSAPTAASGLGSQGGLIGADMTAINRENMERERNRKIDEIQKNLNKLLTQLDQQTKKLLGEI